MAEGPDKQDRVRAGEQIAVLAWGMCAFALALISAFRSAGWWTGRLPQATQPGRMVLSGRRLYRRSAVAGRGLRRLRAVGRSWLCPPCQPKRVVCEDVHPPTSRCGCATRPSPKAHARTDKRIPPGVLCKRRGILYFAGGLARIIQSNTLRVGNARVPIPLRRTTFSGTVNRMMPIPYSFNPIRANLRSSAMPLWPYFSDWEMPFS